MADEQDLKIKIGTEANLTGIDSGKKGLKELADEAKKTEAATQAATNPMALPESMMGPARDELAEQAEAQQKLTAAMEETSAAAEQLRKDQADADVARAKAAQAAREQALAEQNVSQSMERTAASVGHLKMQIAAMAGAELSKGLAAVNPELAGIAASTAQGAAAAGPWGAALGALVGSIGAVKQAYDEYNAVVAQTKEKIETNKTALEQYAQKAAELKLSESYQRQWQSLSTLVDGVNQAIRDNIELENARRQAAQSIGQSARGAEGSLIDAQLATSAITEQEAQTRRAELRQQEAEANKQAAIADAQARQIQREAELNAARMELEAILSNKERALADLAKAQAELDSFVADPGDPLGSAQQRGEIIAKINDAAARGKEAEGQIKSATDNVTAAQNAVNKGIELLQIETEKILQEADSAGVQEKAKELANQVKGITEKGAKEIEAAIEGIQPQNQLQTESLAGLKKSIADGELSAKEAREAVTQLGNMGSNLNTELGKILGVVDSVQKQIAARDRVLKQLQDDNKTLQINVSQLLSR